MNAKHTIITIVAATLLAFSYTVAAAGDAEDQQSNNGYPDYLVTASNDFSEGRGKYHIQGNQDNNGNRGDNGNNGNKNKAKSDKNRFNNGSVWYKPWSWYEENPNNDSNKNSNRQSDPDSTRGQARAEERRDDKDHSEIDLPWYDPWGWFK